MDHWWLLWVCAIGIILHIGRRAPSLSWIWTRSVLFAKFWTESSSSLLQVALEIWSWALDGWPSFSPGPVSCSPSSKTIPNLGRIVCTFVPEIWSCILDEGQSFSTEPEQQVSCSPRSDPVPALVCILIILESLAPFMSLSGLFDSLLVADTKPHFCGRVLCKEASWGNPHANPRPWSV